MIAIIVISAIYITTENTLITEVQQQMGFNSTNSNSTNIFDKAKDFRDDLILKISPSNYALGSFLLWAVIILAVIFYFFKDKIQLRTEWR